VPGFARQATYPVEEVAGFVFVFNRSKARFPMPFFDGVQPRDLLPAPAYRLEVGCEWALVSGNSFDAQHFACAHDRSLAGPPVVAELGDFARRITVPMVVSGHSWRDILTRRVSGTTLTMSIDSWGGNLMFITARFHKTTTYGLLCLNPVDPWRTEAFNIIWVRRSDNPLARRTFDPIDVRVRRSFIRAFLASDVAFLEGLSYSPARTIGADRELNEYLAWLRQRPWGTESPEQEGDSTCDSPAHCS
jgi:phenylpropionate dioxygenase-like ring-hydroxylating dioxygenase large terminal subunit